MSEGGGNDWACSKGLVLDRGSAGVVEGTVL